MKTSLLGLVTRFSHTLQPRIFFHTSLKRFKQLETEPESASKFLMKHMDSLKVSFKPASEESDIIPNVQVTDIPEHYVVPHVTNKVLDDPTFDVRKFGCISDPDVQTFMTKLHSVVLNSYIKESGKDETLTDTLMDDLLRVVKLNSFPLMIRNSPKFKVYSRDEPFVTAAPEFVIRSLNNFIVAVEDKHQHVVRRRPGYGESQLAIEMLACGSENMRYAKVEEDENVNAEEEKDEYVEQTIYAVRIISHYVTFYKAVIPPKYWEELEDGLPKKQSVEILRWPANNRLYSGINLAKPEGRRTVLTSLAKIRNSLLNQWYKLQFR